MPTFEELLPEPGVDIVTAEMAGPRALGRFTLAGSAPYQYLTSGRERFGWLADPSRKEVEIQGPSGVTAGPLHWYILLRHSRSGWRVDKAIRTASREEARMVAGMEWLSQAI